MKRYVLLYLAPQNVAERFARATPEEAEHGMRLWLDWKDKLGPALVDLGTPTPTRRRDILWSDCPGQGRGSRNRALATAVKLFGEIAQHPSVADQLEPQRAAHRHILINPGPDAHRGAPEGQGMASSASRA